MPIDYDPRKPTMASDLNIPDDRADKLIRDYVSIPLAQYTSGQFRDLRPGHIYSNIVNRDELCTNEKAFLIAFLSQEIVCFVIRGYLLTDPEMFGRFLHININGIVIDGKEVKKK